MFELASSMIIKPYPKVNTAQPAHMIGRYSRVLVTRMPDTAEKMEAPQEKGIILST